MECVECLKLNYEQCSKYLTENYRWVPIQLQPGEMEKLPFNVAIPIIYDVCSCDEENHIRISVSPDNGIKGPMVKCK
jgi:hypothetical protein